MYVGIGILVILVVLTGGLCIWKRRRVIRKICCMEKCERIRRVNELLHPFGFTCDACGCIVQSTVDAWQREFGYCRAFDRTAVYFNMVFDCEPVYFDYDGKTWLIEFWKGQYGINTGGEIGIYHTDHVIPEEARGTAAFESALDAEMLPFGMTMYYKKNPVFSCEERHWWLTGFKVGVYAEPEDLELEVRLRFPDAGMRDAFLEGLAKAGYEREYTQVWGNRVSFTFAHPKSRQYRGLLPCRRSWTQWKNRMFCRLYSFVTRPFSCTAEQILCLYYSLPFAFRRLIGCGKYRRGFYKRGRKRGRGIRR